MAAFFGFAPPRSRKAYEMSLLTSTGTVEYTVVSVDELTTLRAALSMARAECDKLRKTLELYADEENYQRQGYSKLDDAEYWQVFYDPNDRLCKHDDEPWLPARAALEEGG